MSLEIALRKETGKWTEKIEKEMERVRLKEHGKDELLMNIRAYVKDSKHFMDKGDLIRSFEAIIWAWAWLEILKELEIVE